VPGFRLSFFEEASAVAGAPYPIASFFARRLTSVPDSPLWAPSLAKTATPFQTHHPAGGAPKGCSCSENIHNYGTST